jgi:hypothetical protein
MPRMLLLLLLAVGSGAFATTANATGRTTLKQATSAGAVRVSTRKVPELGVILVNAKGRTLYMLSRTSGARSPASRPAPQCGHRCSWRTARSRLPPAVRNAHCSAATVTLQADES